MTSKTSWVQDYIWGSLNCDCSTININPKKNNYAISYDGLGFKYTWSPSIEILENSLNIALDIETYQRDVPEHLSKYFSIKESNTFYKVWTYYEVVAKLLNIPILILVKSRPVSEVPDKFSVVKVKFPKKEKLFYIHSLKIEDWNIWATFGYESKLFEKNICNFELNFE
ncbi:hypothetical protein SAMN02746065_10288 [Desulfocicer vacuolatum DSM 3385]|uniref:Uncharacterized protein n=1 Tax=Desulfocicer vacuolatum DSM 3385 TaxID=1121400 RepID=A0A1W1Z5Q6_9BACT|nr:hypothetical protein [Desulfocicer vacuolatum]SMC43704.1 hypothetical protein SAMN02746065_10288 [Desulfocicer vacuolatum DSM 3385]